MSRASCILLKQVDWRSLNELFSNQVTLPSIDISTQIPAITCYHTAQFSQEAQSIQVLTVSTRYGGMYSSIPIAVE